MNIKKRQGIRSSDRWWRYNRRYWAQWAIDKAKARAKIYEDFFSKTRAGEA